MPPIEPEPLSAPPAAVVTETPGEARRRRFWRRWLTVGEVVGLGALVVAGLSYFDAHRERAAEKVARVQARAAAHALVLRGAADDGGARVRLSAADLRQVIETQRYVFPRALLDHPMEVDAAEPQVDRAWLPAAAVHRLSQQAQAAGGEGRIALGVATRYVEDGEALSDQSVYRLGYRVQRAGLFGGERLVLQGVSLERRGVAGDLQAAVERAAARS